MPEDNRPRRPQDEWQREFTSNLRKASEQLAVGMAHEAAEWATRWAEQAQHRGQTRWQEREQRRQQQIRERVERKVARKRARYEAKMGSTSRAEGYAFALVALVLVVMAVLNPSVWWLVFVSLGLGIRAGQIIGYHREHRPPVSQSQQKVSVPNSEKDPRATRIDEICDKLKAALKDAPQVVRDFLSKPEETVEALRKTSHDLLKRELSLRTLVNHAETERLNKERTALQARIQRESDEIVRQRLTGALEALDHQRQEHAEVAKSADRLEAERTRLGYTLEGLYAQVMRLRTGDAGSADLVHAGLRTSLDQLRDEMSALADAVEQVNRAPVPKGFEPPEVFPDGANSSTAQRVR